MSGGKDGVVRLWDESFGSCLKTYQLHSSAIEEGRGRLYTDLPPIRALSLGQGKILVGTKHSEVSTCLSEPFCRTVADFDVLYRLWRLRKVGQFIF